MAIKTSEGIKLTHGLITVKAHAIFICVSTYDNRTRWKQQCIICWPMLAYGLEVKSHLLASLEEYVLLFTSAILRGHFENSFKCQKPLCKNVVFPSLKCTLTYRWCNTLPSKINSSVIDHCKDLTKIRQHFRANLIQSKAWIYLHQLSAVVYSK